MGAAAELLVLSRRRKPHRPDWRVLEEYVSQSWYTLPFTILAFHKNDIVLQAFADDEESWMNGGDEPCPGFFTIMRPGVAAYHPLTAGNREAKERGNLCKDEYLREKCGADQGNATGV